MRSAYGLTLSLRQLLILLSAIGLLPLAALGLWTRTCWLASSTPAAACRIWRCMTT